MGVAADQEPPERTVVARRDPLLGEVFDRRFRIDARIAAGGFGAIYRVTHLTSEHAFALKVLHANLTSDPRVVARFRREGVTLTRLRDRHTITAYELGEADDGTLYIVMELLHGESLYERFRAHGALPWRRVVELARAVCSSLAEAHALGVIHRDLKPTNIHLEPRDDGEEAVKVLDFGIAKILQDSDIDNAELTQAGQMIGTLDYMSPEQMVGGACTPASDLYTLGVVMYEMIAGRRPFEDASSATAALAAVLTTSPDSLSVHAAVPAEVDRVVMRCLERQPSDRFQSASDLAAALDRVLADPGEVLPRTAPPPRPTRVTAPLPAPRPPAASVVPQDTPSVTLPTIKLPRRPGTAAPAAPAVADDAGDQPAAYLAEPRRPSLAAAGTAPSVPTVPAPPTLPASPIARGLARGAAAPSLGELSDATPIDLAAAPAMSDLTPIDLPSIARADAKADADGDATPIALDAITPSAPSSVEAAESGAAADADVERGEPSEPEAAAHPAPAPRTRAPTPAPAPRPRTPTPAPAPAPAPRRQSTPARSVGEPKLDTTLVGHRPASARAPSATAAPRVASGRVRSATPAGGTPIVHPKNLREAYPSIHRPPPSPMSPPSGFDDRPISSIALVPYPRARAHQRSSTARVVVAVAAAVAVIVGLLVAL